MNSHVPFDACQPWGNTYGSNCSNDPLVDKLIGNAYHVVRTVYCNLGNLKLIFDFLNQYGMVLGVQSETELKAMTTSASYVRLYGFDNTNKRVVTDYLYVEGDRTGVIPDDPTATGSWILVATSNSGGGGEDDGKASPPYIPYTYNNGSAIGGETTIAVPAGTVGVPMIVVEGYTNLVGYGFTYDATSLTVTLTQPLEPGDEVHLFLTGTPAVPDNPNVTDWVQINWLYNGGYAVGGEQVIAIPYTFESVPAIYKNGERYYAGLADKSYTVDAANQRILLTEPLATNDRLIVTIGGESTTLVMSDRTVQEVARSANVKDSEVILSSNTSQYLNGMKVVYDVVDQKIYGLPALPTNVYINSVSNGQLTYSPGNITVDLLPVQTPGEKLRQDLLDPTKGTHLITHDDTNLHEYLQKERVLLSEYGGDLAVALSNHNTVIIDSDYALTSNIIVTSGKTIKTINGAKVNVSNGGAFVTEHVSATQYYATTPDVPQIAITSDVASGATSIALADASGIAVGDSLILKNGYCDMWRVLESGDAGVQRKAVDSPTYKSEIVKVLAVAGNVITTSPINYDYPVTPTTYGYITNENNLPEYAGYNRPSVTKMQYKDITLDLDVYIPSTVTNTVFHLSYVDGLTVSLRMTSKATIYKPILITMCDNLNLHDTRINGHKGGVVWIQETTRGVVSNFQAIDWKGGHDTPLCFMLMSPIVASGISVSASEKQLNSSAVYANTCDGGTITGVSARNTARVADVSFSRSIVVSDVTGKNCDFAFGAFSSSSCKLSGAVVEGYCFQNASTTIYTATLVYCSNTTNVSYSDITRVKDKGYGRIRVNGCVGLKMRDIVAPATHYHAVIDAKATEVAQGASNLQVNASDCIFGGFWRESTYYDAADEAGYSYPLSLYDNIKISDGGSISTGGRFNPADKFNFVSNVDCTLDGAIFGGEISGRVRSITVGSTGKNTCFPDISKLKLAVKPVAGVFVSVDTNMGNGSVWSTSFENGSKISDVYSRKLYVNTSVRGTAPVWLQGV